jgi:hypothetical protein
MVALANVRALSVKKNYKIIESIQGNNIVHIVH